MSASDRSPGCRLLVVIRAPPRGVARSVPAFLTELAWPGASSWLCPASISVRIRRGAHQLCDIAASD